MVQVGVPAWLIASGLLSAGPAGATLMAMTLTMAAMGPITGRAARVAYERWYVVGLLGCAAGLGLVAAATSWRWWVVLPGLVIQSASGPALLSPSWRRSVHHGRREERARSRRLQRGPPPLVRRRGLASRPRSISGARGPRSPSPASCV
jgi:hypothetical protein